MAVENSNQQCWHVCKEKFKTHFKRQDTVNGFQNKDYERNTGILVMTTLVSGINWIVAIILPFAYWNSATKDGYPDDPHIIFAAYCFLVALFELYVAFTLHSERLFSFCDYGFFCGCGWVFRVIFYLFVGVLGRSDVYTDGTFVVVAYHTPDTKLFLPAIVMYIFGIVLCQFFIEGGVIFSNFMEPIVHGRGLHDPVIAVAACRHGDLNLIMNVLGERDDVTFSEVKLIAYTCRFCCEDIVQTIIQILFLLEPHKSDQNQELIIVSILIGITLSMVKCIDSARSYYYS